MNGSSIVFENLKDINLAHIFECGQCFRWEKVSENEYVGAAGDKSFRMRLEPAGCEVGKLFNLHIEATGGDEAFWRNYLDLDRDYGEIKKRILSSCEGESSCNIKLRSALEYGYGIRILNQDPWETFVSFIISQNNNIPRIKKCVEALCDKYGASLTGISTAEDTNTSGITGTGQKFAHAFPTAERLAEVPVEELRELKLGYRDEYIVAAAKRRLEMGLPASYEEVLKYHGVGPKVANCIRLFALHETDAFPVDTWVKHIMNDMYGFDESDVMGMTDFAREKFGDYAGYAQQYLFYYYRDRGEA